MPLELQTAPNPTTAAKVAGRSVSLGATARSSADWFKILAEIRERAFFAANVGDAKILSGMKARIQDAIEQTRASGAVMDRGRFVKEMKAYLEKEGYALGGTSITDITSNRRLSLIYDMATEEAKEFARYKNDQNPVRLNMYPAWEFVRKERRRKERQNWPQRWRAAGGSVYEGRMIALKTSDVWAALSVFGRPWAPFDFNSGMGCRDVPRAEAVRLGLIKATDRLQPKSADFNAGAKLPSDKIDGDILRTGQAQGLLGAADSGAVEPRPNPFPVSDALNIQISRDTALRAEIEEAIAAINAVHGDGTLPRIPIIYNGRIGVLGQYRYYKFSGESFDIQMRNAQGNGLTFAHEVGHFLDHKGLSPKGTFASRSGEIEEIMAVIRESDAYKNVHKNWTAAKVARDKDLAKYNKYLLDESECFARSYAQFIAVESKNKNLLQELDRIRGIDKYSTQWSDTDFEPIRAVIKKVFKQKGWMKL